MNKTLKGDNVYLRALEPEDLEFVHSVENDEELWELSNTQTPYSKYILREYLQNAHKDIYEVKQLRLVICKDDGKSIGLIDLFDCDFKNNRAGIGIIIKDEENRQVGLGKEALRLLINYAFQNLGMHQLYCNIASDNDASLRLFRNQGFAEVGLKKDWNRVNGKYKHEYLLQLIKKEDEL